MDYLNGGREEEELVKLDLKRDGLCERNGPARKEVGRGKLGEKKVTGCKDGRGLSMGR